MAWGESEPNGNETQNCVAATSQHFYFWSDENCHNKYQPVCESPVKLLKCPFSEDSVYSEEFDTCYQFFLPQSLTWADSVARCKTEIEDGYLVSVTAFLYRVRTGFCAGPYFCSGVLNTWAIFKI